MAIHKAKAAWTEQAYYQAFQQRAPTTFHPRGTTIGRRRVHVTFIRPGPVSDKDNTYALVKVPADCLIRAGLLVDDSPAWCDLHATTVPGKPTRTIIDLWDCLPRAAPAAIRGN